METMIVKELDPFASLDKRQLAGRKAEEQIAFYLKRAFEHDDKVRVFNGLRLEREGDAAQIDHLVFHRWGMILVESKSVTGSVQVNEQGEWVRVYGSQASGIASPILQAKRQEAFLRRYLYEHVESLLDKLLGFQTYFGAMVVDILVAISDQGIIQRPKSLALPEVHKADRVAERAKELIQKHRKANHPLSLNFKGMGRSFNDEEMGRVSAFLRNRHTPLEHTAARVEEGLESSAAVAPVVAPAPVAAVPAPVPAPAARAPYTCRHCEGDTLAVVYGRYGYYFKCSSCGDGTSISESCEGCGNKARVRKEKENFFAECGSCERSRLFFRNAV